MPDPNGIDSDSVPPRSVSGHPFLTEKGLRLMQSGRPGESYPMAMPHYSIPGESERSDRIVGRIDPFEFESVAGSRIHNVKPSRQFPDVASLGQMSLTPYYQSSLVGDALANELRAIGKLFIQVSSDPNQPLAMGSAWIIGPSTIATAAHNLYDSGTRQWSRGLAFYPGFDYYANHRSVTQPPSCRIIGGYLPREYLTNPATNLDLAICYTDCNIGDMVDARIETQTVDRTEFFDENAVAIAGYPAGSGFDFGKQMWRSVGSYLYGQRNSPTGHPAPVMATNFGGGASGCPWLVRDEATNGYLAVGVTSGHAKLHYARGEHNLSSLVSPYFSEDLFDQLAEDSITHEFRVA